MITSLMMNVLEGADVDGILRPAQIQAAETLDTQVFDVEEGELTVQPIDQELAHVYRR